MKIAIDGPSGAGKSTLARALAQRFGFLYIDTGAMYRAIGLFAHRSGADTADCRAVADLLPQLHLSVEQRSDGQHIFVNGDDVSVAIREHEMSRCASDVSAHPPVRAFLLDYQRSLAARSDSILDGRDIGTVVLPDADLKVFLTASPEVRARRRWRELQRRGEQIPFERVLSDVIARDKHDTEREIAPLRAAEDAVTLDTTSMDFRQSLDALVKLVKRKLDRDVL